MFWGASQKKLIWLDTTRLDNTEKELTAYIPKTVRCQTNHRQTHTLTDNMQFFVKCTVHRTFSRQWVLPVRSWKSSKRVWMPINWELGLAPKYSWELGFVSWNLLGFWDKPKLDWDCKKLLNWELGFVLKINWELGLGTPHQDPPVMTLP